MNMEEDQQQQQRMAENEIRTATAFISTSGPCRGIGDIYLTCVATAGLGMCRSLRGQFEQCTKDMELTSRDMLNEFGAELCRHLPPNGSDRPLCAANLINQQLMQQYQGGMSSCSLQQTQNQEQQQPPPPSS
jgi:hypothetical protein